ncbi:MULTISPECIES: transcription antitermination factor NusB [unclassified Mycoplasma]|uniref:transcription antitermination factor NusB n=1 Tax=unclassified Mycoplasma TaxID=2683645 RepID=UPI00211BBD6A|nr:MULTISPECIES: transcription antitermination factor NusB [unclassified Mycoplasma]UUM19518.1 transcription antitermination protein NusB [Mycoplasma sp. 1578d]UUM24438.1 transcription antitermination protein NusB [Mycoplasma sp. 3686d]
MEKIKSRRRSRVEIIQVLYKFELLNEPINIIDVFENYDFLDQVQLKKIKSIAKNYQFLKKSLISLINQSWSWDRISPVVRAIIINGASECFYLQPKIVFNEAIEITKTYFLPDEIKDENGNVINKHDSKQYKFVNAILQNFYKLLVKMENEISNENS